MPHAMLNAYENSNQANKTTNDTIHARIHAAKRKLITEQEKVSCNEEKLTRYRKQTILI